MKYICSWSGGKDSTASIILAHLNNEPLDKIIMSEVMFNEEISGELPEQMEWVHNVAIPMFESWGYEVEILHSDMTYMDCFNLVNQGKRNSDRKGMKYGFPMAARCIINDRCKIRPIKNFYKAMEEEYIQYVGIATDEGKRLDKVHKDKTQISLLEKYGYTEEMALQLCREYNLLSPIYNHTSRGGCWFCPNARDCELRELRNKHNDLWQILLKLEEEPNLIGNIWNTLKKISIHDKEEKYKWENAQLNIFDYDT